MKVPAVGRWDVTAEGDQVPAGTNWHWGGFTQEGISRPAGPWHVADTRFMSAECSGWVQSEPCWRLSSACDASSQPHPVSRTRKVGGRNPGLEPVVAGSQETAETAGSGSVRRPQPPPHPHLPTSP